MTKQEQIEEITLAIPQTIIAYDGNPKGQYLYGEQRQQIAEALYNAGYHKTIWHKVADGDLPVKDGFYLVYGRGNLGIINKIVEGYWIIEYANGVLGDGKISHNEYEEGNIAWTELPEYKE